MPSYLALTYTPDVDWTRPAAGLALVDAIGGLDGYPWWHATRAELLHRLGRTVAAREAYQHALRLGTSEPQLDHLRRRLTELPA